MTAQDFPPVDTTADFTVPRPVRDVSEAAPRRRPRWVEDARRGIATAGCHLAFEESGRQVVLPLGTGVTRIGRSVSADVRFEDSTVSRRHAVLTREGAAVRLLDDRSLNGVEVNGTRVESRLLSDGDEIRIGRHTLWFLDTAPSDTPTSEPALAAPSAG